jgi:glutathione peroxidase-family protein
MKKKFNVKIYSLNEGDKPRYIGKTHVVNKEGKIRNSLSQFYNDDELRKIKLSKNFKVEEIETVESDNWFDAKLQHIVNYHKNKHADLLNAPYLLDGKRGYWEGKTRDNHTINRLAESKYVKIVQYDINGNLTKIWHSIKDAAINFIGDYLVVNGSAQSKLFNAISNKNPKKHLEKDCYWFREKDILKHFLVIPKNINIDNLYNSYREKLNQTIKKNKEAKLNNGIYIKYDKNFKAILKIDIVTNKTIKLYKSLLEAGEDNNIHQSIVSQLARNIRQSKYDHTYTFALTKHREKYNLHDPKNINAIIQVDHQGNVVGRYKTSNDAAKAVNGTGSNIRKCARGKDNQLRHRGYYWYYEPKI